MSKYNYIDINNGIQLMKVAMNYVENEKEFDTFISELKLNNNIYMSGNDVFAFCIKDNNVFYYNSNTEHDLLDIVKDVIEKTDGDITTMLTHVPIEKTLSEDFINSPKFIINNTYYIL